MRRTARNHPERNIVRICYETDASACRLEVCDFHTIIGRFGDRLGHAVVWRLPKRVIKPVNGERFLLHVVETEITITGDLRIRNTELLDSVEVKVDRLPSSISKLFRYFCYPQRDFFERAFYTHI